MAYSVASQGDSESLSDFAEGHISACSEHPNLTFRSISPHIEHVSEMPMAGESSSDRLSSIIKAMLSTRSSYEIIRNDDSPPAEQCDESKARVRAEDNVLHPFSTIKEDNFTNSSCHDESITMPTPLSYEAMRTVSREGSGSLRHPTPDLQSVQGAYVGNVERLERSAERLSLSSDIGEELRKIRMEQKRSESRRSSALNSQMDEGVYPPPISRQFSASSATSNSILGLNSIARSGGFSPNGYVTSPVGSLRSPSWSHYSVRGQSTSRVSRLSQLPEPEKEGRPLDSLISSRSVPISDPPKHSPMALRIRNESELSPSSSDERDHTEVVPALKYAEQAQTQAQTQVAEELPDRPTTAASTDTYRQATTLFADFDGVHITPHVQPMPTEDGVQRRLLSLKRPPLTGRPQSYAEPPPGEDMVYYPAPVPMMLNLPQKLSKLPSTAQREKRRSQVLRVMPVDARKSAAFLPGVIEANNEDETPGSPTNPSNPKQDFRRSMAAPPPQLRADMFFEHPSLQQEVVVKENSAVATLDSILDASAHAPVSAFTDHPIVGYVGAEIYARSATKNSTGSVTASKMDNRKRRSSFNMLKHRQSSSNIMDDAITRNSTLIGTKEMLSQLENTDTDSAAAELSGEATPHRYLGADGRVNLTRGDVDEDQEFLDAQEELEAEPNTKGLPEETEYGGAPTTLLAELQMRKHQQKQRNRTAATAFPHGMHSTLLELDTVAQMEKKSRKQKHITLAWEDPSVQHPGAENANDEDVPLAMLFPERKGAPDERRPYYDDDVPLGLIARRDMEDNEPLSHRRARLRGEPPALQRHSPDKRAGMYNIGSPSSVDLKSHENGVDNNETLGDRLRRFKGPLATSNHRPISGDFASEVMSHFGGLPESEFLTGETDGKSPEPEEETLGQRRKRLQAERRAKSRAVDGDSVAIRPSVTKRHSMADILHAHPVAGARSAPYEAVPAATVFGAERASPALSGLLHQHEHLQVQRRQQISNQVPMDAMNDQSTGYGWQIPHGINQRMSSGDVQMASGFIIPRSSAYDPNGVVGNNGYATLMTTGSAPMLPMGQEQLSLDLKQMDMIDRWRQSVMH
ncbi:hypothetical protein MMC24_003831 [Lignoscripta atroalba]|nr:hypothetical protein [Lignoscripta atroalba]